MDKGYSFSERSLNNLSECHPLLQDVFFEVIKIIDCSILEGYRNEFDQNRYFHQGLSKLRFPKSKHNKTPSLAVDVAPYPIDWSDRQRFILLAGTVKGVAHQMDIRIRWGGDWNCNNDLSDESFLDLPHYELIL